MHGGTHGVQITLLWLCNSVFSQFGKIVDIVACRGLKLKGQVCDIVTSLFFFVLVAVCRRALQEIDGTTSVTSLTGAVVTGVPTSETAKLFCRLTLCPSATTANIRRNVKNLLCFLSCLFRRDLGLP